MTKSANITPMNHYGTKQVIVMRKDLNMRKGKMIAQGAHAATAFLTRRLYWHDAPAYSEARVDYITEVERDWLENSFAKVCVGVDSEEELRAVIAAARDARVTVHEITDNGTTEFGGVPTLTCCAVGPDTVEKVDAITGELKLL